MTPAAQNLLISIFIVLLVSLPVMSWLIGRQYKESSARLWFSAIALDAVMILLLAFKTVIGESISETLSHSLVTLIFLLMGAALNMERREEAVPVKRIGTVVVLFGFILSILNDIDGTKFYSAVWINFAYILLSTYVCWLTFALIKKTGNINLRYVLLGWLISLSGYVWRLIETVSLGERILIFSLTPVSNWIIVSNILTIILISLGYLGYMQDKLIQSKLDLAVRTKQAELQRQLAETHARELGDIIKQRDHMVMVNSRFQAISGLALFNSAIIHEISQPVSGLTLCLQRLSTQVKDQPTSIRDSVFAANEMSDEISRIVSTLRSLIQQGSIENQALNVAQTIQHILPVIETECQLKNIDFSTSILKHDCHVMANASLLQRIILNLAANAIDAMTDYPGAKLRIEVTQDDDEDASTLTIRIRDNGKGMTDEQLASIFRPFASNKHDGVGVGLALGQILVMRWGGEIVASRLGTGGNSGMCFDVRLPVLTPFANPAS